MNRSIRIAVYSILAICILGGPFWTTNISAQNQNPTQHKAKPRKKVAVGAPERKYDVEQALPLELRHCTGEINLPEINFLGDGLEISGGQVSLLSRGTAAKRGEVIAYAQSQYF